ncbi:hypothetical protein [Pseudomonas caricapapayae]|nr:hypothetical protein [Pseudomonas caricapapayae]
MNGNSRFPRPSAATQCPTLRAVTGRSVLNGMPAQGTGTRLKPVINP